MKEKEVVAGFDGFVDIVAKPLKSVNPKEYFSSMQDLAKYMLAKSHCNLSIEYEIFDRRGGGNMPNFAYSLACKGVKVSAIGTLGEAPEFDKLKEKCEVYSYGKEYIAHALEFESSKMFLAPSVTLDLDPYEKIASIFDTAKFLSADAFALLNWSEISFSTKLWKDIYDNHFLNAKIDKSKIAFFDLCDIQRRSEKETRDIISLIKDYNKKRYVILSANKNEFQTLAKIFHAYGSDLKDQIKSLYSKIDIDEIVVHTKNISFSHDKKVLYEDIPPDIKKAIVYTGAGDNFNASFLYGRLRGFDTKKCLETGNLGACRYISEGKCADFSDID